MKTDTWQNNTSFEATNNNSLFEVSLNEDGSCSMSIDSYQKEVFNMTPKQYLAFVKWIVEFGVIVKPLVWDENYRSGEYSIHLSYGQGPKDYLLSFGSSWVSWGDSYDELMKIAQDHHKKIVLRSLELVK